MHKLWPSVQPSYDLFRTIFEILRVPAIFRSPKSQICLNKILLFYFLCCMPRAKKVQRGPFSELRFFDNMYKYSESSISIQIKEMYFLNYFTVWKICLLTVPTYKICYINFCHCRILLQSQLSIEKAFER